MSEILMTNIFFIITGISSIITTIVLVIALIYVIKFLRRLERISEVVEEETVRVMSDVQEVRTVVKTNLNLVKGVANAAFIKTLIEKIFNRNK